MKLTLIRGDALKILPKLKNKNIDLILTDPPYGIKRDKGFGGFDGFRGKGRPIRRRVYENDNWDAKRPSKEYFNEILKFDMSTIIIFGGNYFTDLLPQSNHWLVWDKFNTMPTFGDCELIWTNIKRNSIKKIVFEWNGLIGKERHRFHPTQKPIELIKKLITNYTKKEDSVLDPFLGSGTTMKASLELDRNCIGIEINQKYIDIIKKRLNWGSSLNTDIEFEYIEDESGI